MECACGRWYVQLLSCKKSILADDCTADRYRKAAFVVEVPQDTTSEEVIDQLRKHGQQSK